MNYMELLYEALHSPLGLVVETEDVEKLRQKLYSVRRSVNAPELSVLSFVTSPLLPRTNLWIVRRPDQEASDAQG